MTPRRLLVLVTVLAALLPASARAAEWPAKPVRIVVAFPPGGTNDTLTRYVAHHLVGALGQPVVVENNAGASGAIATAAIARAPADGYTLLMASTSSHVTNRFLHKRLDYDPDGFEPVSIVARFPLVLIGCPSAPGTALKDLVSYARANPGKLTYASFGTGSTSHFQMEMFRLAAGVDVLHVPFRGATDAVPAVISCNVSLYFTTAGTGINHYRAGKVKAYAVTGEKRLKAIPDVPTFAEQGFADADLLIWIGLVAPKGTPRAVVEKVRGAVNRVLASAETADRFTELGAEPGGGNADRFATLVKEDLLRYGQLVKALGIAPQ
jgi:tripartite-type tricarboxylate transporter receptor subunit TctC